MMKPSRIAATWAPSSEFVSSSVPSWQISTAHAQPFRGARDLAFCLKVPLDSLLVWASSGASGETALMRRLAWTIAARIGDKYQIRLTRPTWQLFLINHSSMTIFAIFITRWYSNRKSINIHIFFNKYSSRALSTHLGHFGLCLNAFSRHYSDLKCSCFFASE